MNLEKIDPLLVVETCQEAGISLTDYFILYAIVSNPRLGISLEAAKALHITHMTLYRHTNLLAVQGYITISYKKGIDKQGRIKEYRATEKSHRMLAKSGALNKQSSAN